MTKASPGPNSTLPPASVEADPALEEHAELGLGIVDRERAGLGLPDGRNGSGPRRRRRRSRPGRRRSRRAPARAAASAGSAAPSRVRRMDVGEAAWRAPRSHGRASGRGSPPPLPAQKAARQAEAEVRGSRHSSRSSCSCSSDVGRVGEVPAGEHHLVAVPLVAEHRVVEREARRGDAAVASR